MNEYLNGYAEQAYKLCLLGATHKSMAAFFGVRKKDIRAWMEQHAEFADAVRRGTAKADMEVAHALYAGATDRTVVKKKAIKLKEVFYNEDGKRCERETIEIAPEEQVIPGNNRSQMLWLKNRRPQLWKDGKQPKDKTGKQGAVQHLDLGAGINPDAKPTEIK